MDAQTLPVSPVAATSPQAVIDAATAFMAAKHLFAASELGIFEKLADGPVTLDDLAHALHLPSRTTRIVVDAVTALGFVERDEDRYRNAPLAAQFLSGRGPIDMRPFVRFWNRLSYPRWITLEDSVRKGEGVAGPFAFSPEEQKIFSEGVDAFSIGQALGLADAYDFSDCRRVLDLGGGTGSFLKILLDRYPHLSCTLFELPQAAAVAKERLGGTAYESKITVLGGDFLRDSIPAGHDVLLMANVVHTLLPQQNQTLLERSRRAAAPGARLLIVDLWTNPAHTEPRIAALMAGEFLVIAGHGDVYSVEEGRAWLEQAGWSFIGQTPLGGPASLVIAEARG